MKPTDTLKAAVKGLEWDWEHGCRCPGCERTWRDRWLVACGIAGHDEIDPEEGHQLTDRLMELALVRVGWGDGVEMIRKTCRWYS